MNEYGALVERYWPGETEVLGVESCPSAILSTTNLTWTDLGLNQYFRGERPATNRVTHGMAWPSV